MSNLLPQKRPDKNGRMVTRHVRTEAPGPGRSVGIPAPVASVKPGKPAKLLPRQMREDTPRIFVRENHFPDSALKKLLPFRDKALNYDFQTSDVILYDMFSVIGVDDAIHLAHMGHSTKEAATSLLHSNGLGSLLKKDRSSVMQEALQRRIPADKFADLHAKYGMAGYPTNVFLDACEAYSSGVLRGLYPHDEARSVHVGVLAGDVAWSDIKAIGIGKLQKSNAAEDVLEALRKIKSGEYDCTVEHVVTLIEKNNEERNSGEPLRWALRSINVYGADYLRDLSRLHGGYSVAELCEYRNYKVDETKGMIDYTSRMREAGSPLNFKVALRLRHAGVDPDLAGKLHREGKTPEQIIEISNEGIPTAVSAGWL